jgi:uncharacterized heparinase superfamily protein
MDEARPSHASAARRQIGQAIVAAGRAPWGALARLRRAPFMQWRQRPQAAEELLIAPPDLRTQDPSLVDEIEADTFGLAGCVALLHGRSPFAIEPPNREWERELHGFGWLRHLEAMRTREVESLARELVREWIVGNRRKRRGLAWAPEVVARRVISWLSHAALLLDEAGKRPYATFMRSLDEQVMHLSGVWRSAPDGYPRLLALIALVKSELCIAGRDRQLDYSMPLLVAELERQILPDGGHVSRNAATLVELMLDLLPLRQCFGARGIKLDPALSATTARMAPMLRTLLLGDGLPARFNGVGFTERDALATALAYDHSPPISPATAPPSGYLRVERGPVVIVMDAGTPPHLEVAGSACAGALSFEMSTGSDLLLVNAGRPAAPDAHARALSRSTASHNTLCLNEQSSSTLVRNAKLEQAIGGVPIRHPDVVKCVVQQDEDGGIGVEASHDGYLPRFSLVHTRKLRLDATGTRLDGLDVLSAAKGVLRLAWDLPFAIHFHLHPEAEAGIGQTPDVAELALDTGELWRLSATGAALSIEDGTYFADIAGPRPAQCIVLRGVCAGATEVGWCLERVRQGRVLDARTRQRIRSEKRQTEVDAL